MRKLAISDYYLWLFWIQVKSKQGTAATDALWVGLHLYVIFDFFSDCLCYILLCPFLCLLWPSLSRSGEKTKYLDHFKRFELSLGALEVVDYSSWAFMFRAKAASMYWDLNKGVCSWIRGNIMFQFLSYALVIVSLVWLCHDLVSQKVVIAASNFHAF